MQDYINVFTSSFKGTLNWTLKSILFEVPWYLNYFWGLLLISLLVWGLEILFPWRKQQGVFRKDFGLDAFYMFFNFFLFALVINGVYGGLQLFFQKLGITLTSLTLFDIKNWAFGVQLFVFFVLLDFLQWLTTYFITQNSLFVEIPSSASQCKGNGLCGSFSISLDGKYSVQTF